MKTKIALLMFLMFGFVLVAHAQTGPPITIEQQEYNGYPGCDSMCSVDSYITAWGGQDSSGNFWVYTSTILEGAVNLNVAPQDSAHYYTQSATLAGKTVGDSGGYTPNYVELTNPQEVEITPGEEIDFSADQSITCNYIGNFFNESVASHFEYAITYDKATGPGKNMGTFGGEPVYQYPVANYCSNGTPDYNPSTLDANNQNAATDRYFAPDAILFRILTSSTWSVLWPTGGATDFAGSEPNPTPVCTHTGPQK